MGNKCGLGNKSRKGQTQSVEERLKKSKALLGRPGKIPNEETRIKLSEVAKNRPKLTCPHCHREIDICNYAKSHGDKCKLFTE